jgi:hypothetical protein
MEQSNELARSKSNTPIIRAGLANILVIYLVVLAVNVHAAVGSLPALARVGVLAALALAFLTLYRSFVSRIVFRDDGVLFVRPFSSELVTYADIERVRVRPRRFSSVLSIKVHARERRGSSTYRVVSAPWSVPSLRDSHAWLTAALSRRGVALG